MNPETTTENYPLQELMDSYFLEQLNMFFSKDDELHPELAKPFRVGKYTVVTDGNAMAWIHSALVPDFPFCEPQDKQKYLKHIRPKPKFTESFLLESLRVAIDKAEYEEELIETEAIICKECNGAGQVEWTYGNFEKMRNCPICDGSGGTMKVEKTGKMIPRDGQYIQLGISAFEVKQLKRLYEMSICGANKIIRYTTQVHPLAGTTFEQGAVSVLIMPCLVGVDYQNQIIAKINPL